jgi:para-aminobenzoate synthetase component 1
MSFIADITNVFITPFTQQQIAHYVNADTPDAPTTFLSLFSQVASCEWSILLDTAGSKKSDGRFNIMAWNPALMIRAARGQTEFIDAINDTSCNVEEPPFEATEKYLHKQVEHLAGTVDSQYAHLPFIVGVAGMAGYDSGRFYETLPSNAIDDYETPDFAAGLYLQSIIEDTETGLFYYCSVDGTTQPDFFRSCSSKPVVQSEHGVFKQHDAFAITQPFESNLTKEEYCLRLSAIHCYLTAGDCYQVNMAQRFTAHYRGDFWDAYCRLRETNQAPFSAYFHLPEGTIASISPERFLSVKNGIVETKPIKGTRPRYADKQRDEESANSLLNAEKDRSENLMIVDLLRNDISKHCVPGSVNVPALFALESYEAVHHLVSTVTGKLANESTPLDLLASAFPGGSITGAPKIRSMEIIDELEPHRRNIYCGSIFYMGCRQDMDSSICIRTVLAENNKLHCWAGGGIVLDSQAPDEYQETLDKVSKIIPVLAAFNEGNE